MNQSLAYTWVVIPAEHRWLFWDVDADSIDIDRHADYVLERVMLRGDWAAMRWLVQTFTADTLADFLARKQDRLPPRERAFWSLIAGRPRVLDAGGGRPSWAG